MEEEGEWEQRLGHYNPLGKTFKRKKYVLYCSHSDRMLASTDRGSVFMLFRRPVISAEIQFEAR